MHTHVCACTRAHRGKQQGCLLKSQGVSVEHTHGQAVVQKCPPQHLFVPPSEQDSPALRAPCLLRVNGSTPRSLKRLSTPMHPGGGINEQGSRSMWVECMVTPSISLFLIPPPLWQPPAPDRTQDVSNGTGVMVGLRSNSTPHGTRRLAGPFPSGHTPPGTSSAPSPGQACSDGTSGWLVHLAVCPQQVGPT